jgi:hypothetical protein
LSDKLTVSKPLEDYEKEAGTAARAVTSRLGIYGAIIALQRKDKGRVKGGSRTIFSPVKTKSYPVEATTLKEAAEAIEKARGKEAGATDCESKVDYSVDEETGIIKSANVTVTIEVSLSRLVQRVSHFQAFSATGSFIASLFSFARFPRSVFG